MITSLQQYSRLTDLNEPLCRRSTGGRNKSSSVLCLLVPALPFTDTCSKKKTTQSYNYAAIQRTLQKY